jgi:hypothetical protein
MFSAIETEWLPAFGVSWQIVHVPFGMGPETGSDGPPFSPGTLSMTNWRVLKVASPRAIA